MANDQQVDVLKQGAEAWNAWRAEQPQAAIDLAGAGLRGLDLSEADLTEADLQNADLRGANLAGAVLAGARLGGANLFKALLDGADLEDADLRGVQFLDCPRLAAARNWQSAYRDGDLACGAATPKTEYPRAMPKRDKPSFRRLAVITGDHATSDPTKHGAAYGPQDLDTHNAMVAAIEELGRFDVTVHNDHKDLFERLSAERPDLVVNFCDTGVGNQPTRELNLPAWLELHGIPYTGAPPQAMVLTFDKQIVRLAAQALGVEVPRETFVAANTPRDALPGFYPALIKPNAADGSVGITKDAVVRDEAQARRYLDFLARELPGRDVLWQEYLPGPEYGFGLIGNPSDGLTVLPPLQVDFSRLPKGLDPILSFESKTDPASPYWTEIKFERAGLDDDTLARLSGWARTLFHRLGLQDYGRFDFRCAADGRAKLLEVNANPAWANDGKLAFMAGFAGIAYAKMLEMIIDAAIRRLGR